MTAGLMEAAWANIGHLSATMSEELERRPAGFAHAFAMDLRGLSQRSHAEFSASDTPFPAMLYSFLLAAKADKENAEAYAAEVRALMAEWQLRIAQASVPVAVYGRGDVTAPIVTKEPV